MTEKKKEQPNKTLHVPALPPIAIIGLAGILPEARDIDNLWENILDEVNCIKEVPPSRWSIADYYDPDPNVPDKTYSKHGGFIPDIQFDPMEFGLPPNLLEVTDVSQLLSLVVAKNALKDAGYLEAPETVLDQTGVILGMVGMSSKVIHPLLSRLQYPVWEKVLRSSSIPDEEIPEIIEKMKLAYVQWNENAFPGAIGNVVAGRIANRLDLGGANCIVDAACASSLAAVSMAVSELALGKADMMITGGVDTDNSILTYLCFSKTPAFSKGGKLRAFSEESDGMLAGEGIGMLVLKRLADAERDGDNIYAVIRGIGASSDGHFKSIYAPRSSGQAKAVRRAYQQANYSPASVRLIEAHGTGTNAGDPAEFNGLTEAFSDLKIEPQQIALGSIKSQIGHTKATAGAASLIKTALALHQKILPATINVSRPHPAMNIEETPFYLNTETRPWFAEPAGLPRRAGVSSFGFGGTNFHITLEEYNGDCQGFSRRRDVANSVVLSAETPQQLLEECRNSKATLESPQGEAELIKLEQNTASEMIRHEHTRIGFTAQDVAEALKMFEKCINFLTGSDLPDSWSHPSGIFYRSSGLDLDGKVVALFPGQGSQYVNMGKELALNFPTIRSAFEISDKLFLNEMGFPLTRNVFPIPVFSDEERNHQNQTLTSTENAQPAIGTLSLALLKLLTQVGFSADHFAGHSFGELTALCAAGVYDEDAFIRLAIARGKAMGTLPESDDAGNMLAIKGDTEKLKKLLEGQDDISIANFNSPNQVVLAGSTPGISSIKETLEGAGFSVYPLNVSAAFHTGFVAHAQAPFNEAIQKESFKKPRGAVYSNSTGQKHNDDPRKIAENLKNHILNSVRFKEEIETIYQNGGRVFVEIGPKKILTNLVKDILAEQPHETITLNPNPRGDSDLQLRQAIIQMRVLGFSLGNTDPHRSFKKHPENTKSKVAVTLNGGLYTTQKTIDQFEKALANKRPKSGAVHQNTSEPVLPVSSKENQGQNDLNRNANMNSKKDITPILEKIQEHQSKILTTHEQFLANDAIAKGALKELISTEISLLAKTEGTGTTETDARMLDLLEKRANKITDQQSSIASAHKDFIQSQSEFTKQYTALIAQLSGSQPGVISAVATPTSEEKTTPVHTEVPAREESASVQPQPQTPEIASSAAAPKLDANALKTEFLNIVSDKTGYPTDMLELSMDMEADLGIDSIKRVEILAGMQEKYPGLPTIEAEDLVELRTLEQIIDHIASSSPEPQPSPAAAAPIISPEPKTESAENAGISVSELETAFLEIVSEKTGYPTDMLELDMDMEADLGIDSIKRVEILSAMQDKYPSLPTIAAEDLADLRTLKQIIDYFNAGPSDKVQKPSPSVGAAPPESNASKQNQDLEIREAKLVPLPRPDQLEFQINPDATVLITDDGSGSAHVLAKQFASEDVKVGLIHFAEKPAIKGKSKVKDASHYYISDLNENAIQSAMENIISENNDIAAFIHFTPHYQDNGKDQLSISEENAALLKTVFLMARHLGKPLTASSASGRPAFLAVTSVDGKLGLSGSHAIDSVSGGYAGLTKSLRLEWPEVFCRTIDLHPDIKPENLVEIIQAELHDPDLSVSEVGYTPEGRYTIMAE